MSTHLKSPGSVPRSPAVVRVPKPPSQLDIKTHSCLHTGQPARGAPGETAVTAATSPVHPQFRLRGSSPTTPSKHQYFMGSCLLASNFVFNCRETIQSFRLGANRLLSARQPEQAGVIILKASDGTAPCAGCPNCPSAVAAVPLRPKHPASRHPDGC